VKIFALLMHEKSVAKPPVLAMAHLDAQRTAARSTSPTRQSR
jgi:hypothetical protein